MPSLTHLHSFIFLLLLLASLAEPVHSEEEDSSETSGLETEPVDAGKWPAMAEDLHHALKVLYDEQFQKDFGEPIENAKNYEKMRIKTPVIPGSEWCGFKHFRARKCLKRFYTGLRTFRKCLAYVERENQNVSVVKEKTNIILSQIEHKIKDSHIEPYINTTLPEGTEWDRKIITHSIIHNFRGFINDTLPGIRFLNKTRVLTP